MTVATSPVRLNARLDPQLSRWLWLLKWLLVIPHLIVLVFLWVAFGVLSVVAFVAILITGRYPLHIFEFNLGVLRWSWRVGYYAYGALGTDRYPPFTLGAAPDYPATLDIAYPEHLSRGLIWVKWLLALPHYVIIAFFVGGGSYAVYRTGTSTGTTSAPDAWTSGGLIGLLVLIAGIALLLTGRYPRGLFDLLLGMHRWVLRVAAYTSLMTDEYPPFRLDMGGSEPSALVVAAPLDTAPLDTAPLDTAPLDTAPLDTAPDAPGRVSPPPSGHWTAGRITAVVIGSLLLLGGIGTAVGATAVLTADRAGRDSAGFLNTPAHTFTSTGYALVFDPVEVRGENATPVVGAVVGDIRVHATGSGPAGGVFVGIGPAAAVESYLATVDRERLVSLSAGGTAKQQRLPGGAPATPPAQQPFWVASAAGPGPQQLTWTATEGRWAAAVMNADGSRPVIADLSAGATAPGLRWVWTGMYIGAGIGLLAGIALVLLGTLRRRPAGLKAPTP
jgi:hypothetical protein